MHVLSNICRLSTKFLFFKAVIIYCFWYTVIMTASLRLCERPRVTLVRGRELFDSFCRHKPKCQLMLSHLYSCFEVRLYLHASRASDGAIVHHLGDSWMTVQHQWNENWHGRTDAVGEIPVTVSVSTTKPKWTVLGVKLGLWRETDS